MSAAIQALPTEYRGRLMRSHLEARWAVYFDALVRPWDYEVAGYSLPSGCYLPDFWLPIRHPVYFGAGYWFEVKPDWPNQREARLCWELARKTKHTVQLIAGPPVAGEYRVFGWHHSAEGWEDGWRNPRTDSEIPGDALTYTFANSPVYGLVGFNEVADALRLASRARFEHGEHPKPGEVGWRAARLLEWIREAGDPIPIAVRRGRIWVSPSTEADHPGLPDLVRVYESQLLKLLT